MMSGVSLSRIRASLGVLGATALLAGCGGEPDAVTDRDSVLRLRLDEYRIVPQALRVREGKVRIVIRNEGRLTHNVKVEELTNEEGATPVVYGGTETTQPGQRTSATIRLLRGTYRLVCTIGNHENLGQYGELEVEPAP